MPEPPELTREDAIKITSGFPTITREEYYHEGWALSVDSRKYHYFVNRRSLCRRYDRDGFSRPEQGNDNRAINCRACQAALAKRKQGAMKEKWQNVPSAEH